MSKTRTRELGAPDSVVVGDIGYFPQVDFLTCGSCQKEFLLSNIVAFMHHKKLDCDDASTADSADLYYRLMCQIKECKEQFATAWALLQHVQTRHIPNIYTALQLYAPGIESIQLQTSRRPPVTTSSGTLTSAQQTGVDVRSLCMLGLGDTFDDISPADIQDIQVEKLKDDDVCGKRSKEGATVTFTSTETQTDAMQICTDAKCNSENCAEMKCCDDQNCCITIMPGTHEKPKKCCSAIVPKKRKQHMESKHMPSGQTGVSTRSQKRRAGEQRRAGELLRRGADRQYSISSNNDTIFIDVTESNMDVSDEFQDTPEGSPMPGDQGDQFSRTVTVSSASVMISTSSGLPASASSCTSKGSMIIQPGSTVTIPPSNQAVFPTPTVQPSAVTPGLRPLAPRLTNQTPDLIPAVLTFPYLLDAQSPPQLNNLQENITSINFSTSGGDKAPKFFISSSKPFTQTQSSNGTSQHDPGASLMISSPGSPQDSKSIGDDSIDLRAGGKKRRYPTSRPFKCEECGNSFNQRIHLKKHLSKHTGIKPYKCGQCDYSTVERSHLKVHIRIHTGEKPFKCTFCEYATAQNSTLKIHLKRHHSGKEMGCSICGKVFNQPIQLNNHRKDQHGVAIDLQSVSGDEQSKTSYPDTSNDGS